MMEENKKYGIYVNGVRIGAVTGISALYFPQTKEEVQREFDEALKSEQYEKLREITSKAKALGIELDLP